MQKRTLLFVSTALMISVLTGCGGTSSSNPNTSGSNGSIPKATIRFWTGFGSAVNAVLKPMIDDFQKEYPGITVNYEPQGGGYDGLKQAVELSVAQQSYPNMANGYPDHFASYISSNIMLGLDGYINHPEFGTDIDDFYQDYLNENQNLVKDPVTGKGVTMGIPFNKSTEIMVTNETFFEVMHDLDPSIRVPETWDELDTIGTRIKEILEEKDFYEKLITKRGDTYVGLNEGQLQTGDVVKIDFTRVTKENFIPFNWDSTDNFFITLVRQWGGVYTTPGSNIREGFIRFNSQEVIDGLTYIKDLADRRLVGIPTSFGEALFASTPFKQNKVVLTISSSAGIQENIPDTMAYPFKVGVRPILYKDAARKYVISQGTNLAIFNRRNPDQQLASWLLIRYLTVERNAEFARKTSYFPVTKSAQQSEEYQNFLNGDTSNYTPKEKAVFDTAVINNDFYMDPSQNWIKFVDPAFAGSSQIRDEVSYIIGKIIQEGLTPQQAINEAYGRLGNFIPKN